VNALRARIGAIAIAFGIGHATGADAQTMSKPQYKSGKDDIAAEYKAEKDACGSMAGNDRDICKVEAAGREKVARAELEAKYKPSEQASYNLRIARADADYAVARERCDDSAGNVKDVCLKAAKAAEVGAKADARAGLKTANANSVARAKGADARKDADSARRDADFAVAKEKCDVFAGEAKSSCLNDARARFGKS
jgi:hypothetical protein